MDFRKQYQNMNEQITPDSTLIADTLTQMTQEPKQHKKHRPLRRVVAVAAAATVAAACITPALAANVPSVYGVLHTISPAAAQFFMPINKADEDDGIKMEVVSTAIKGNTAEVLVTVQDTQGALFGGSAPDLYDSYSLIAPTRSDQYNTCELADYDAATSTATYRLKITNADNTGYASGKYTFSVRELLTGKQKQENVPISPDLSAVVVDPPTTHYDLNGASYFPEHEIDFDQGYDFLNPQGVLWQSEDGIFSLVAAGYYNNQLHLQYNIKHSLSLDNHAWFPLYAADGTPYTPLYSVTRQDFEGDMTFEEYVYDIPLESVADCTLTANIYSNESRLARDLQVTFRID